MTISISLDELNIPYVVVESKSEKEQNIFDYINSHINDIQTNDRHEHWNNIWGSVKRNADESQNKDIILPPWFVTLNKNIFRWNYHYTLIAPEYNVERLFCNLLLNKLTQEYIWCFDNIVEFGAGSGSNLLKIKNYLNDINIHSNDFSENAVLLQKQNGIEDSFYFDIVKGVHNKIDTINHIYALKNCVYMTFGALEQISSNFKSFVDFLLDSTARLFIHVEPIKELYQPGLYPMDEAAIVYHEKRGYLEGYLTYLETIGIHPIEITRTTFGTIFNEGYMVIVWLK